MMHPPIRCDECTGVVTIEPRYFATPQGYMLCACCPECKSERLVGSAVYPSANMAQASVRGGRFQ